MKKHIQVIFCAILFCVAAVHTATAQSKSMIIVGTVVDEQTDVPIANASVFIQGIAGSLSDSSGAFRFNVLKSDIKSPLKVSIVGYNDTTFVIDTLKDTLILDVSLRQKDSELQAVVVKSQKEGKYRNKNNPAVELIRQVIAHKAENQIEAYQTAQYQKYEKLVASLSNVSNKLQNKKFFQKYKFLLENVDTTKFPGKGLLPLYLHETMSNIYYQKNPAINKQVITGENKVDFGEFIDSKGVTSFLNRLYQDVNIYDNNISLFTNQFLSPISGVAPSFYMYYIRDTLDVDGIKVIQLAFKPRNEADLLFRGTLYITLDGHYAVQKLNMFAPKGINLNFMRELRIGQTFEKRNDGRYMLSSSDMIGDFGISQKGGGIFGERFVKYNNLVTDQPLAPAVKKLPAISVMINSADNGDTTFWNKYRPEPLSIAESKVYSNIDSLKNMPSFRKTMDWITLFLAGYKQSFHNKFEIGPASTFYSFNPVEGLRLRFGGRTTPNLSRRFYFETYGAYGFKDEKFKYFGSFTYSINNKSIYQFPQHYIRASFQHDTKIPGQELQFVQEDNLLLSFKRGNNDKWLYNDLARIDYVHEFENHFSFALGYKYWRQSPAGSIYYIQPGANNSMDTIQSLRTSEFGVTLRYAPHEGFYQGKLYRTPIINEYPIFTLRYIRGIKGLTGGEYNYNNFEANVYKRFYLSQLGYTDVTFDGGYTQGKIPFPLLSIHHANQTYAYQLQSYNLMNFLEFASDHYASLFADHYFNGFFFNKIPLIKKLKWREVIEGKILYGGVRAENDPNKNPQQMYFPTQNGSPATFALNGTPYVEGGFGIANIFKLLRIDYVRRFTYLDNPDIPKWGIRAYLKFDF